MTIKDLLLKFEDKDIIKQVFVLYPNQKKNKKGYLEALVELRYTLPIKSSMEIILQRGIDEGEKYVEILIRQGKREYSASFIKWGKFLHMPIFQIAPSRFTELDMLCHCLWEMTWHGYSDASTQKRAEEMKKIAKEIKEGDNVK